VQSYMGKGESPHKGTQTIKKGKGNGGKQRGKVKRGHVRNIKGYEGEREIAVFCRKKWWKKGFCG